MIFDYIIKLLGPTSFWGGMGLDGVSNCVIEEELAYGCSGIGVTLGGNGLAVCFCIFSLWLRLLLFESFFSFALAVWYSNARCSFWHVVFSLFDI